MTPAQIPWRRLLWAVAASLALHLLVLSGPAWRLPSLQDPLPQRLEARLAPLPPKPVAKLASRQPLRRLPVPKPASAPPPTPPTPTPAPAEPAAMPEPPPPPPEPALAEKPQPGEQLPSQAEIRYTLYKGANGLGVGRVVHTWQRKDGHYTLSSVIEATGLFSLIKPGKLVQTSQGEITELGLKPAEFWVQRGQGADTTEFARFDWKNGNLRFGSYQDSRTTDLPERAQDLLSFLYQFAFAPPASGVVRLHITNGRKLDSYDYAVVGEEMLELPFGKVRTLHLAKQHAANEDGTEVWLSAEHRYFPVKIRQTDKQGDVAEQVAREIHLSFGDKDKDKE